MSIYAQAGSGYTQVAQAMAHWMLTFSSGKSGRCSNPKTKTEAARMRLEFDFRGTMDKMLARDLRDKKGAICLR
jgi:hypothetical protein